MRDFVNWLVRIAQSSKADFFARQPKGEPIDRALAAELVAGEVRAGFLKFSEIQQRVRDEQDAPLTEEDERWLESEVRRALKLKRRDEDSWPEDTTWDHLNGAFKALRRKGIVALHKAGDEEGDGLTLVAEEREENPSRFSKGYCFYHGQDVEGALASGGLYLSHGAFEETEEARRAVAALILEKLKEAGIDARWSGSLEERIHLPGFIWQKRSPRATGAKKKP